MAIWSYRRGTDTFDIKVGYNCNNECVHCVVHPVRQRIADDQERQDLNTGEVEELIDTAIRAQAKTVVLTGGEVTIRDDFVHLLQYAAAQGLKILIQTNARMLARRDLCEALTDFSDLVFVVALHASSAEVHDSITRRRGSFDQTCAAIRNLRAINKEVAAKIVLSKLNRGELMATSQLARNLAINEFCVVFPHALDFREEQFMRVVPRYREIQAEVREACLYSDAEAFQMTFETIPYCVLPDQPEFWRRSCDLHSAAVRRERGQSVVAFEGQFDWEQLRPTMKKKENSCAVCVFDPICEGPWREYVDAYGFDEFRPVPSHSVAPFLAVRTHCLTTGLPPQQD